MSDAKAHSKDSLPSAVLSTCFLFALVSRGIGETFAVFLLPLQQAFGWDRAQVTGIYAVTALAVASVGPLAGYFSGFLGTRRLYAVGGLLLLMAYVGAVHATELWHFYVTLGFCVGAASAFVNVAQTPLIAIWFSGRVGTVFGAMNMAGSFGAMLFPLTVGWLVAATGTWNAALVAFAALMAIDAVLWSLLNPRGRFSEVAAAGEG